MPLLHYVCTKYNVVIFFRSNRAGSHKYITVFIGMYCVSQCKIFQQVLILDVVFDASISSLTFKSYSNIELL